MDPHEPFSNMFDIVIQLAAIIAVIVLYWKKFLDFKHPSFYVKLAIAVAPSLIFGVLLKKRIDHALGDVTGIAVITLLGGVLFLFVDKLFKKPEITGDAQITNGKALQVGLFQVLSVVFPGFSRSGATIIGGLAGRLDRKTAAEFSFFLAVPTMAAATAKDVWDTYKETPQVFHDTSNMGMLAVGCLVSFLVSLFAIRSFLTYVQRHSFRAFGIYRIIAGMAILALIYSGMINKNYDKPETKTEAIDGRK